MLIGEDESEKEELVCQGTTEEKHRRFCVNFIDSHAVGDFVLLPHCKLDLLK
jgi:hypothetical protein